MVIDTFLDARAESPLGAGSIGELCTRDVVNQVLRCTVHLLEVIAGGSTGERSREAVVSFVHYQRVAVRSTRRRSRYPIPRMDRGVAGRRSDYGPRAVTATKASRREIFENCIEKNFHVSRHESGHPKTCILRRGAQARLGRMDLMVQVCV